MHKDISGIRETLTRNNYDFAAKYLAVQQLQDILAACPEEIPPDIVPLLASLYDDPLVCSQTQAYFALKEAAAALCSLAIRRNGSQDGQHALTAILSILRTRSGRAQRAGADALSDMPFSIQGPRVSIEVVHDMPQVSFEDIVRTAGVDLTSNKASFGRSMAWGTRTNGQVLVIKWARPGEPVDLLATEVAWMEYLGANGLGASLSFSIPRALKFGGRGVVQVKKGLPASRGPLSPNEPCAICFLAPRQYFAYPNDPGQGNRLGPEAFLEVITRNARILGFLASRGVVHEAPIPLFHNRVQRERREDGGLYRWQRAGRLDRWLESCWYPNFGVSGIRDFEHLLSFQGKARNLYPYVGTHLLSLLLVIGSYFRAKDPKRMGLTPDGQPADARNLFEPDFLRELVMGVFSSYYQGFVGEVFPGNMPVELDRLVRRMVEEMGVDRHMEEILRATDQQTMTREQFVSFLVSRGFGEEALQGLEKGREDITILSGPHLGGFNQTISLPEMIEAIGAVAAMCIFGRYRAAQNRPVVP